MSDWICGILALREEGEGGGGGDDSDYGGGGGSGDAGDGDVGDGYVRPVAVSAFRRGPRYTCRSCPGVCLPRAVLDAMNANVCLNVYSKINERVIYLCALIYMNPFFVVFSSRAKYIYVLNICVVTNA